jgi:hypothetical protein
VDLRQVVQELLHAAELDEPAQQEREERIKIVASVQKRVGPRLDGKRIHLDGDKTRLRDGVQTHRLQLLSCFSSCCRKRKMWS